jgi:hypothetical protein
LLAAALAGAQTMTEYGAATAGAVIGGASGKAVSNGITAIFGKMDQQTVKAAGKEENKAKTRGSEFSVAPPPAIQPAAAYGGVSGGASSSGSTGSRKPARKGVVDEDTSVPPPPPLVERAPIHKAVETVAVSAPPPGPFAPFTLADVLPATPIPPPPTMTPESFRRIAAGMSRHQVLSFGEPSSRVSMFEDGHMVEMFSYRSSGQPFGHLRLEDGTVVITEAK